MKIWTKVHDANSENVFAEISELAQLCHGEQDVQKVLDLLVEKVAKIMNADVSSLYLHDFATHELVLKATKGLNLQAVDHVRMKVGEGLVGKTIEWLKPVSVSKGARSKSYKFFPGSGEEKYSSFLSVPLIYNRHPIGVLVIQNEKPIRYSQQVIQLMLTIAIPVVTLIEKAKLLGTFDRTILRDEKIFLEQKEGSLFQGIAAAPGIAVATLRVIQKELPKTMGLKPPQPIHKDIEKMRLLEAFRWVEEEIRHVKDEAVKKFGMEELAIFDAYHLVLESDPFKEQILEEIEAGRSALQSLEMVMAQYTERLNQAEDEYLRERAFDIKDISRKISDHLIYGSQVPKRSIALHEPSLLYSEGFSISDFVEMDPTLTKGILCPVGGASSHIAILAQSLGIPAVMGLSGLSKSIRDGVPAIMDGSTGVVVLNPSPETRAAYARESRDDDRAQKKYDKQASRMARPIGSRKRIWIGANMGIMAHVHHALDHGAEEIGLYRTEFPFLMSRSLPTEEEQYQLYRKLLEVMGKKPVTIRTLDIGGDKYLPYLNLPVESNPFLGWRSIRISLEREDLFSIQLRAMVRAAVHGNLRILFPMISSVEEILRIKEILSDVKAELKSTHPFSIGMMIEVPSAVIIAEALAKEVNFFSIGTNDLTQYTLAVDRNNPKVAKLYNPLHPAVLKSIEHVVRTAHRLRRSVSVCGEMAGRPMGVFVLIGMGIDRLSMSTPQIAKIKSLINELKMADVVSVTKDILKMSKVSDVEACLIDYFKKNHPEFLPHATHLL